METKDTGDQPSKPAEDAAKPADDRAQPTDASKPAAAAVESSPAEGSTVLAKAEPAPAAPGKSGTFAGIAALLILLGGVLGTILIARHNEASHKASASQKKKKGPKKDTTPWNVGDKQPITITVVGDDSENLVCAAKDEINGKHCAYETKDAPWPKAEGKDDKDAADDKVILRPYATVGERRLIAAGFWSQLPAPLPEKRFTVKCTFVIEGKLDHPWVKFRKTMDFKEVKDAWYAGELTDCAIANGAPGASGAPAASAAPAAASAAPDAKKP